MLRLKYDEDIVVGYGDHMKLKRPLLFNVIE